jgi:hypothetical protein
MARAKPCRRRVLRGPLGYLGRGAAAGVASPSVSGGAEAAGQATSSSAAAAMKWPAGRRFRACFGR